MPSSELGSLNPRYWYIDENGAIQKYVYCRMCLDGPFKAEDEDQDFIYFGVSRREATCVKCAAKHNYFDNPQLYPEKQEKFTYIDSPFK